MNYRVSRTAETTVPACAGTELSDRTGGVQSKAGITAGPITEGRLLLFRSLLLALLLCLSHV